MALVGVDPEHQGAAVGQLLDVVVPGVGPLAEHADLDDALRRTLGLSLELLDRLPAEAIRSLVHTGDPNDEQRLELLVRTLEARGRRESDVHATRRNKAAALSRA